MKPGPNRDLPFGEGWLFRRGGGEDFKGLGVDDAKWRHVDLPHDWGIEDLDRDEFPDATGPFDKKSPGKTASGFTLGGEGWYRKHFRVDDLPSDASIEVLFEGAYLESEVFLNGQRLGGNVHGYIPFAFDLTPHLDRSGDNVLAVHIRNLGRNSRWYSGSGLYRPVTLDVLPGDTRIARWGVGAWTRALEQGAAEIGVATTIVAPATDAQLVTRLIDVDGKVVAEARTVASSQIKQTLTVRAPRLWSPDNPCLYSLSSEVQRAGKVVDTMVQPFGIRIVHFDPNRGMTINGSPTKLLGGCVHHDNGLLGARAFADADDRRVRLLKARGFNAIRSSHNPSSLALRNACDRLGMMLIEEAFDTWQEPKEPQDFSTEFPEHWQEGISGMVMPARNSPSVIMWSIGNEIPDRSSNAGVEWSWKLANAVKSLDPTRPVTAGLNGVLGSEMVAGENTARTGCAGKVDNASTLFLDVPGYNYRLEDVEREQVEHPERIVYASETFASELFRYREIMDRSPYFLGEFLWTAMDYIGEAGLGATAQLKKGDLPFYFADWPWVNAWCGDIDLIGQQKAASLARDVAWGISDLEVVVQRPVPYGSFEWIANWGWPDEVASWTWPGLDKQPLTVRLFSSAERVELRLNGQLVQEKALSPADNKTVEVTVPYEPGILEVKAFIGGRVVGTRTLETAGDPAQLRLTAEPLSGRTGRDKLVFVSLEIVDSRGRQLPADERDVSLRLEGPAELIGFGSANPQATGSYQATRTKTYRGRALAVLRAQGSGRVDLEVQSDGLSPSKLSLSI